LKPCLQAPDAFSETFYVGLLFCLAVVVSLVLAAAVAACST
jgi:hypothetical protein